MKLTIKYIEREGALVTHMSKPRVLISSFYPSLDMLFHSSYATYWASLTEHFNVVCVGYASINYLKIRTIFMKYAVLQGLINKDRLWKSSVDKRYGPCPGLKWKRIKLNGVNILFLHWVFILVRSSAFKHSFPQNYCFFQPPCF